MTWSREKMIGGILAVVILFALGYGGWLLWGPEAKNKGLKTHENVQTTDEVRAYLERTLKTEQAAVAAQKAAGMYVNLNLYADIASDAYSLGDLATARIALEAELAGNKINYTAWDSYGTILEGMGDYAGARAAYEKAIDLSNNTAPETFYIHEVNLLEQHFPQDDAKVKSVLEASLASGGQTSWNMVELGKWYQRNGDCQSAIDHYKVAVSLAPQNKSIQDDLQALLESCAK